MEEFVENLGAENAALRRKLQSKAEALLILSKELDDSRKQRDQFKLMAEQLQHRYSALKKKPYTHLGQAMLMLPSGGDALEERNKSLRLENEELKQQLRDAFGDLKALRTQIGILKSSPMSKHEGGVFPAHQKEEMVQQLESLHIKGVQLRQDLQSMLDEKEELIVQRDTLRSKVHRLNHELQQALSLRESASSSKDVIDVDSLIAENTYLHDRLQQMEQEKEFAEHNLAKYKSVVEKSRNKGAIRLGSSGNGGLVVSHKQVQQLFLHNGGNLPQTPAAQSDLHSLYLALLEALNDKNVALSHQKKTNRILGKRIAELERRLGAIGDEAFPSKVLMNGYNVVDIDKEVDQILAQAEKKNEAVPDSSRSDTSESSEGPKPDMEDDDTLPPNLQEMVMQALEDIRREANETEA